MNETLQLNELLLEYSELPEYLGMEIPSVNTKSNFLDYPINIASTRGDIDEVKLLLKNGADINASGEHGYTPLHNAVEQEHIEIVSYLLSSGTNPTAKNNFGDTPLELARILDYSAIEKLLEKANAL